MRRGFMLYPERDLAAAIERWHRYGLVPLWWPDGETVLLGTKPGPAQVMLEDHPTEHRLGAGPMFIVEDVDAFKSGVAGPGWLLDPCDVPVGRYAAFTGPNRSAIRILDLTHGLEARRALFLPPA